MVWKGKPASVCDHGFERSDLCAEIIILIRGNDTTECTLVILRHNRVLLFIQLE